MKEVGIDNLEVTLSEEYMPGLIGGSLDITHGDTSVFFGSGEASGLPIKMVSLYRDKEWWIMGVRKGIEKPEDLKGAKITGGSLEGRNTWVMRQVVAELGLDPDKDVEFVPTSGGSDGRLQALLAGTVDAASLFPRHQAGLEAAGGKFISAKLHEVPQEGFAAMGGWLEKNEDTAYAWAQADVKARQWMFDPANKDQSYKIMRDLGFDIPPEFEAQYQLELDQISPDGGFASAEVMDKFVESLAITGDVPKGLDWRKYVDMKYVWAAQEALGLPKRPASF
jgi:ABC-type nitrate/sulfonate/bicarbonate transport system substrate-binding protein